VLPDISADNDARVKGGLSSAVVLGEMEQGTL